MSSEFTKKRKFKMKRLNRPIYVRNIDSIFNHEELIKHMVEVKLFYRGHSERTEIYVVGGQKWSVILEMSWLVSSLKLIGKVKMMRCLV